MIANLFIPKLGMTMEKGTISEWVAKDGDQVQKAQVLLVLETEKVAHEIESPCDGFLAVLGQAGNEYPCGAVVGVVASTREEYEAVRKDPEKYAGATVDAAEVEQAGQPEDGAQAEQAPAATADPERRIFISPLAKKMAQINKIDITRLSGSGPEGRIVKHDIEKAIQAQKALPDAKPAAPAPAQTAAPSAAEICEGKRVRQTIPFTGMRKKIADNLHLSHTATARVAGMFEFDVTELVKLRSHYASKAEKLGFKIAYTDLFVYMIAKALGQVPIMNASIVGDQIKLWQDINIGLAVSVEKNKDESGLMVPVIRNADRMSLSQICKARHQISANARDGKLTVQQMTGGTFTYSNTGMFGGQWAVQATLINYPEAAIMSTSSIVEKPVVKDGEIVIRPIMPISLTFDHRVMDAAPPAKFINIIAGMIEDPWMIMM